MNTRLEIVIFAVFSLVSIMVVGWDNRRMERPDPDNLSCVKAACQLFRQRGHGNLAVRKPYSRDQLRLLRCRRCGEEFSERRGMALFNAKVSEAKASAVIDHLVEGCSVSSTARLDQGLQSNGGASVARFGSSC